MNMHLRNGFLTWAGAAAIWLAAVVMATPVARPALAAVIGPPSQGVITGALRGTRGGMAQIRDYLAAGGSDKAAVVVRLRELIKQVRVAAGDDAELARAAVDRVYQVTSAYLRASRILSLTVESAYKPGVDVIAFDFGDAELMPGFERVDSTAATVSGKNLRPKETRLGDALMRDGLVGVEEFKTALKDGEYRVIVLTQDDGDPATSQAPFGDAVLLNDEKNEVLPTDPQDWEKLAYLTTPEQFELDIGDGTAVPEPDPPELTALLGADVSTDKGGAFVMYVTVVGGELVVEFDQGQLGNESTFVTGVLIEPADRPSMVVKVPPELDLETAAGGDPPPPREAPPVPTSAGSS